MKKTLIALFVLALLAITSCTKTDDRDQFEGDYALKATGSWVFTIEGQNYSEPINVNNASLSIYKASAESEVSVHGFYVCSGYVSGNSITLDPMTETQTQDGISLQITFTPRRGSINGGVLTFLCDISGTGYYQGYSFPVSGSIYNEAIKQQ